MIKFTGNGHITVWGHNNKAVQTLKNLAAVAP